jgi:hypothetical protein
VSSRRAPVDEVMRVLELFDTRYWDFGSVINSVYGIWPMRVSAIVTH